MPLSTVGQQKHWGIRSLMISDTRLLKTESHKNLLFHFYLPVNEPVGILLLLFVFKSWKDDWERHPGCCLTKFCLHSDRFQFMLSPR